VTDTCDRLDDVDADPALGCDFPLGFDFDGTAGAPARATPVSRGRVRS
jgi:hypothetical protein